MHKLDLLHAYDCVVRSNRRFTQKSSVSRCATGAPRRWKRNPVSMQSPVSRVSMHFLIAASFKVNLQGGKRICRFSFLILSVNYYLDTMDTHGYT